MVKKAQPRRTRSGDERRTVRCAIYTRVSTYDQSRKDYSSLDTQREYCRKFIELMNATEKWVEVGEFSDTKSGETLDRPQLQALMELIRQGQIDMIVVYKLDRLSRSVKDFYELWELLENYDADFASATEHYDTSSNLGRLMLNMMMVFAEFERERIKERTAESRQKRAEKGEWGGGLEAFGYRSNDGLLIPDPIESQIVCRIFADISQGIPAADVARWLRAEGIKTRQRQQNGKTVGGKWFNSDIVKAVIRNVVHKGCLMHNEEVFPGEHQAIVSQEIWERANRAIAPEVDRRAVRVDEDKHGHLLKGVLVCGQCGTALTPHPAGKKRKDGKPYLYYTCTNVAKHGTKTDCGVRNIPAPAIEEVVVGVLGELSKHPEVIEQTIGTIRQGALTEIAPLKEEIAKRSKEIGELMRREDQLAKHAADPRAGGFSTSLLDQGREFADRREHLERERAVLQAQIGMKEVGLVDSEKVAAQLRAFHGLMNELSADEQKDFVRLMLKEVRVNRFDPEKQKGELGETQIPVKIRTKWYSLNVTLFSNELFSRALRDGVKQFVSKREWLPGLGSNQRPSD